MNRFFQPAEGEIEEDGETDPADYDEKDDEAQDDGRDRRQQGEAGLPAAFAGGNEMAKAKKQAQAKKRDRELEDERGAARFRSGRGIGCRARRRGGDEEVGFEVAVGTGDSLAGRVEGEFDVVAAAPARAGDVGGFSVHGIQADRSHFFSYNRRSSFAAIK